MKLKVKQLSPELFWDVDIRQLDWRRHERFILQRVLQWGNLQDWQTAKSYYGLAKIRRVWRSARELDPKSRAFWRVILNKNP